MCHASDGRAHAMSRGHIPNELLTLPISLDTVSDSLLTKLATKPTCTEDIGRFVVIDLPWKHAVVLLSMIRQAS